MKNSTAFLGKNPFSSPYSCAASVLLCDSTSVGRPKLATTCAIVIVFPEPVTPRSVWYRSPRARPVMSSRMARGWSPAGANGDTSSKGMRGKLNREGRRFGAGVAARHLGDALHAPHRPDDLVQVALVLDLDEDAAEHRAVPSRELGAADVGPRLADRLADVGVQPAPVLPAHGEPHDERLSLGLLPIDLHPPFRLGGERE